MNAHDIYRLYYRQVEDYHITDQVDAPTRNPFEEGSFEYLLWQKSHVDTVQWHLEDLIRPADVEPTEALRLKRRIDALNQQRTNLVEQLDDLYMQQFAAVQPQPGAGLNTETPAWALDRLSILALKLYHFGIEAQRTDCPQEHRDRCALKLETLRQQQADLQEAIDQLLADLAAGRKRMRLYRQMKMYNDPTLNPALYKVKGER